MAPILMTDSAECLESCRRAAADVRRTIADALRLIVGTLPCCRDTSEGNCPAPRANTRGR